LSSPERGGKERGRWLRLLMLRRNSRHDNIPEETPSLILPLKGGENGGNPSFCPPLTGEEMKYKLP